MVVLFLRNLGRMPKRLPAGRMLQYGVVLNGWREVVSVALAGRVAEPEVAAAAG